MGIHDGKTIVGYFYNEYEAKDYPMPEVSTDPEWIERKNIIKFGARLQLIEMLIKSGEIKGRVLCCKGSSTCRICGKMNGSEEYVCGNFVWPSGYNHYILEHNVKPPQEFIDFINNMKGPTIAK